MDAVLDRPLPEIVSELALAVAVSGALLGEPGELREALHAARAYEQGQWATLKDAMPCLSLPETCAPERFQSANLSASAILH